MNRIITWRIYLKSRLNLIPSELGIVKASENSTKEQVADLYNRGLSENAIYRIPNPYDLRNYVINSDLDVMDLHI